MAATDTILNAFTGYVRTGSTRPLPAKNVSIVLIVAITPTRYLVQPENLVDSKYDASLNRNSRATNRILRFLLYSLRRSRCPLVARVTMALAKGTHIQTDSSSDACILDRGRVLARGYSGDALARSVDGGEVFESFFYLGKL